MKKILLFLLIILSSFTLQACGDGNIVEEALSRVLVPSEVYTDFKLVVAFENIEISWSSNNEAITIASDNAKVSRQSVDTTVTLSATGVKGDLSATYSYNVKVLAAPIAEEQVEIFLIEEVFDLEDNTKVKLEGLSVQASYSSGTHFTDGENVIYAYGIKNLNVGATYDLVGVKSTYGTGEYAQAQLSSVTTTAVSGQTTYLESQIKSIEYITNQILCGFYKTTGIVEVVDDKVYLVDGDYKLEVSSYNLESSLNLLTNFDGYTVTIELYLTGGHDNKTILTYVTVDDIETSDDYKVVLAANALSITEETLRDIVLPTESLFDSNVVWSSSNDNVLSSAGVLNRQDNDTVVTLTATVTFNGYETTKTFDVNVLSNKQRYLNELFISEYSEGKSNNKYIEIYNPSSESVDLTDYTIKIGQNGALFGATYNFTGIIPAKETFVVAVSSSATEILDLLNAKNNLGATSSVANFNGDDALGLFKNNELIDIFGIEGVDPGTSWNMSDGGKTVDYRIIRKEEFGANPVWDTTEWVSTAITDSNMQLDNFGIHTILPMFKED